MTMNSVKKVFLYETSKDKYEDLMNEIEEQEQEENADSDDEEADESDADDYDQIFITRDDTDSVVFSIIEKFIKRSELGVKKYGTDLDREDLHVLDWIRHAQEEHMDAILYLEKLKQEFKLFESKLSDLAIEENKKKINNIIFYISILIILFYNLFITYHYNQRV